MRYFDFRDSICRELRRHTGGLTWAQLRDRLALPYRSPCSEWVRRMEDEDGLRREKTSGRALVWKIGHVGRKGPR